MGLLMRFADWQTQFVHLRLEVCLLSHIRLSLFYLVPVPVNSVIGLRYLASNALDFLDLIEWRLKREGINSAKMTGSMPIQSRSNIIISFQTDADLYLSEG